MINYIFSSILSLIFIIGYSQPGTNLPVPSPNIEIPVKGIPGKKANLIAGNDLSEFIDRVDANSKQSNTNTPTLIYINRKNLVPESEVQRRNIQYFSEFVIGRGISAYDKKGELLLVQKGEDLPRETKYLLSKSTSTSSADSEIEKISPQPDFMIWDPISGLKLGNFTLHFYSLMWLLAFGIGYILMVKIYKWDGVNTALVEPFAAWTILGAIFGARLGHVFFYERELFSQDPLAVFLPIRTVPVFEFTGFSGLASHGAATLILITTIIYSIKTVKKNPLWVFDRLGIVSAIGGAFVRVGNFFNSEIIGKPAPSGSPFAVLFPQMSTDYGAVIPRYPSQLFEAAGYFTLFIILWVLYKKTNAKNKMGWLFGFFLIVLFGIRVLVEFLKEPQGVEKIKTDFFNTGQILSFPFILLGIVILLLSYTRKQRIV